LLSRSGHQLSTFESDGVSTSHVSDDDEREDYIDMTGHKVKSDAASYVDGPALEVTRISAISSDVDATQGAILEFSKARKMYNHVECHRHQLIEKVSEA
jgi:hypothetical protein